MSQAESSADRILDGVSASEGPAPTSAHTHASLLAEYCLRFSDLLKKILETLQQSTIAGRVDYDTRARFWKLFKTEAEEFHADFLRKHNGELDISLIFAGLFSAISGTFASSMQTSLAPDPNDTTHVLLMMVIRSLNSTAFADKDLDLPQFTPDPIIVWSQTLLFASLGASLFAALAAMLGKEWLSHYARVGERGTIEDRCIDRQRKFIAMQVWQFDLVLACIPLLLQSSLLLFGISLSAYMWGQQRTIASVILAITVVGVMGYASFIICSLIFPDCPFHTPITDIILAAWQYLTRLHIPKIPIRQWFSAAVSCVVSLTRASLAKLRSGRRTRALSSRIRRPRTTDPQNSVLLQPLSETTRPLDALCVEWLLVTSTDPDAIFLSARMAVEIGWSRVRLDLRPMRQQLEGTFLKCFCITPSGVSLLPFSHDKALVYGQASLSVRMDMAGHGESLGTLDDSMFSFLRGVECSDPDLKLICDTVHAIYPSPPPGPYDLPGCEQDIVDQPSPLPSTSLIDWLSDRLVPFLYNENIPTGPRIYFAILVSRWLGIPVGSHITNKARANLLVASSMLLGYRPAPYILSMPNKRYVVAIVVKDFD
ncbi:hypothetical protein BXZ70DRAFT_772076 [Cristinia sonorae]|uniref:DUF6535 domain-containing protein n=1 Tax=Cristinia sonorae TaxID=1940300 RepID=A0A8K0UUU7_9AGAR|nr:hypothetical protein BXZ70DRAFT_772076 [Cristinia sonorae]